MKRKADNETDKTTAKRQRLEAATANSKMNGTKRKADYDSDEIATKRQRNQIHKHENTTKLASSINDETPAMQQRKVIVCKKSVA